MIAARPMINFFTIVLLVDLLLVCWLPPGSTARSGSLYVAFNSYSFRVLMTRNSATSQRVVWRGCDPPRNSPLCWLRCARSAQRSQHKRYLGGGFAAPKPPPNGG